MSRLRLRLVMLFALAAIMLRVLIPVGYMPDLAHGKLFTMTICTLHGPQIVTVDDKFNPVSKPAPPQATGDRECPFSALQQAVAQDDAVGHAFTAAFDLKPADMPPTGLTALVPNPCACVAQPRAPPAVI